MSRVDRSYSKYESIRTYEDRGKMKWNPFATAELASAHRDYRSDFNFSNKYLIGKYKKIKNIHL